MGSVVDIGSSLWDFGLYSRIAKVCLLIGKNSSMVTDD